MIGPDFSLDINNAASQNYHKGRNNRVRREGVLAV